MLPLLRDDVSAATEGVRAPALQAACGSVRRRRRHMTSTRQQCDQAECCSICLEVLPLPSQEDPVTVLPCNHCFHESCVDPLWHALLDKVTAVPGWSRAMARRAIRKRARDGCARRRKRPMVVAAIEADLARSDLRI